VVIAIYGLFACFTFQHFVAYDFSAVFRNVYNENSVGWWRILFLTPYFLLPSTISSVSLFVSWILSFTIFVPFLLVAPQLSVLPAQQVNLICVLLALGLLTTFSALQTFRITLKPIGIKPRTVQIGSIILLIALLTVLIKNLGIKNPFIWGEELYMRRAWFKESLANSGSISGYCYALVKSLIAPCAILVGLERRQPLILAVGLVITGYVFGLAGEKSSIFAPLALLPAYLVLKHPFKFNSLAIAGLIMGLISALIWISTLTNSKMLIALIVRRVFFAPAQMAWHYFDYFWNLPAFRYADGSLRWLFTNPYPYSSPPQAIGLEVFNNPATHANAAFFADAYVQAGWLGFFLSFGILILFLLITDCVWRCGGKSPIIGAVACLSLLGAGATGIQSLILTKGLGPLLLFAYLSSSVVHRSGHTKNT
jgi:hypothetical protein